MNFAEMPELAGEIIETFQPYHRGAAYKDDPLWKLNKLSRIDKHHTVVVGGHGLNVHFPDFPGELSSSIVRLDDKTIGVPPLLSELAIEN